MKKKIHATGGDNSLQALTGALFLFAEVLLFSVGMSMTGAANAELLSQDINYAANPSIAVEFDLDYDGSTGFSVQVTDLGGGSSRGTIFQSAEDGVISALAGSVVQLFAGDVVDSSYFDGSRGSVSTTAVLRDDVAANGSWLAVGTHGFVALRTGSASTGFNYGWAEITHESLTSLFVGRIAFENITSTSAPIPGDTQAAPEPAPMALLGVGVALLTVMRRRRRRLTAMLKK